MLRDNVIIHHISDIHVGTDHYDPKNKTTGEQLDPTLAFRFRAYVKYLESGAVPRPDLVVLSGDFVSKGNIKQDFETAYELIERLVVSLNKEREFSPYRLCLVPGNHDLDWSKDSYEEKIANYRSVFGRLVNKAIICDISNPPYFVIPNTNVLIYLLNSCPLGGRLRSGFAPIERTLQNSGLHQEAIDDIIKTLRTEQRIDPGYVENEDLRKMMEDASKYKDHLKIAVMHHNLSAAPSDYIDQFSAIINAGEVKEYLQSARFDMVLHGHQHHPYCTYEQIVPAAQELEPHEKTDWQSHRHSQGVHIVGAPSLGTSYADPNAPRWFQLGISPQRSMGSVLPSSLVEIREARSHTTSHFQLSPAYRLSLSKPLSAQLSTLHEHLGRTEAPAGFAQSEIREAVDSLLLPMLKLKARLDDWDSRASGISWQSLFLEGLNTYQYIFGTDLLGPVGWMHANYLEYIHKQFEQKLRRKGETEKPCEALCVAMDRTGWATPMARKRAARGVQIARILLWDDTQIRDDFARRVLGMVDLMHRLHDVPVFVLDPSAAQLTELDRREEFVFVSQEGIGNPNCYVYDTVKPDDDTKRIIGRPAADYFQRFCDLLQHSELRSIKQVLS